MNAVRTLIALAAALLASSAQAVAIDPTHLSASVAGGRTPSEIETLSPFGTVLADSLTFEAASSNCYVGGCAHPSDHSQVNMSTVPPVPEPGTLALMFSGLAVVAWVARRRNPD